MLELHELQAVRGGRRIFDAISARVAPGELLRVTGANGAGKTTLLRLLCGLAQPAAGEVRWQGRALAGQRDAFNQGLVYIGHGAALKDELDALENLLAACRIGGVQPAASAAVAALAAAGLRGRARAPARALSQGQRRRAVLARLALASAQPLWVLDEPFNALDADATAWLSGLIEAQRARSGIVVLTSHQPVPLAGAQQTLAL